MTAIGIDVSSDRVILVIDIIGSGIKTNLDPSKQTIANIVTEVDILREGIVGGACLNDIPHVLVICRDGLGVGVVWVDLFDGCAQSGVPEELADVSDVVCGRDSVVGEDCDVHVGKEMGVGCTT